MQQCPPNLVLANPAIFFRTILHRIKHILLYFRMSLISHLSRRLYHPFKLMMLCSLDLHFPYQEWSLFIFRSFRGTKSFFRWKEKWKYLLLFWVNNLWKSCTTFQMKLIRFIWLNILYSICTHWFDVCKVNVTFQRLDYTYVSNVKLIFSQIVFLII